MSPIFSASKPDSQDAATSDSPKSSPVTGAGPHAGTKSGTNTGTNTGATRPVTERRRRRRAKIAAQLRVRPAHATHLFQEICTTLDVSRDGLLFQAARRGYSKGQRLEILFPYEPEGAALHHGQIAEVMRVSEHEGALHVAVQFLSSREQAQGEDQRKRSTFAQSQATAAWMRSNEQPVVLAVEPEEKLAESMREALQKEGYNVVVVQNSKEALDAMRKLVPSVVIAEAESPEISGQDLCLIIKRDTRLQAVPVILMTRSAQPADYSNGNGFGAVICMAKPFKMERLQHVVRLVAPPKTGYGYSGRAGTDRIDRTI